MSLLGLLAIAPIQVRLPEQPELFHIYPLLSPFFPLINSYQRIIAGLVRNFLARTSDLSLPFNPGRRLSDERTVTHESKSQFERC